MAPKITASKEALFRFLVVSAVLSRRHGGLSQQAAVATVANQPFPTLDGAMQTVSERTIYRWLSAWTTDGVSALEPMVRPAGLASAVLPADLLSFLAAEKGRDPRASVPELVKRARAHGFIAPHDKIDRVTVWRSLGRMNVATTRSRKPHDGDSRRFEYANRMQMLLCDGKHFRAGSTRAKRVALFLLDDASRLGLHVVVGPSESEALFLRGLYGMVRRNGLFDLAYLDHGPGFIAHATAEVILKLQALLVLGVVGYPQGRGKIERFNQTAENAILRSLDGQADVDPACGALELRLGHWMREVYNHEKHESLGMTPWERWSKDERALRFPDDDAELRRRFVLLDTRRVTNDHTVSVDSVDLEVPKGYAGQKVQLHCQLLDGTIAMLHEGRLVTLHPVDKHKNAVSGRSRTAVPDTEPTAPLPPSAATLAFRRDLEPLVGSDGGFVDPSPRSPDGHS